MEFALVLPLLALLMGVAFNGWNGIQLDINLTSAARAGAVAAANSLAGNSNPSTSDINNATGLAITAINQAEGVSNVYQGDPSQADYVNVTTSPGQPLQSGITINVLEVTISNVSVTLVPVVGAISLSAHASARYS